MEKRPEVMVELARERKPFEKVERSVVVSVFVVSEPNDAICEKRLVDDAVVAKKEVDVAPLWPMRKTVVEALLTASKRLPVPHVVSLLYGEVVPMPTLPVSKIDELLKVKVVPFHLGM